MKNRYSKVVLEADKGITFKVSKGTNGQIIIRARKVHAVNIYSKNYVNPPIPEGYKHVEGEWNNGFVIERCSDGSQFVWIPVEYLNSDGTLDGKHFSKKFGRRNYQNDDFSDEGCKEYLREDLIKQIESIKKYGGFYISRYNISKSLEGEPQSVKGAKPWTYINYIDAKKVASEFENSEDIKSHLPFGAEYDSVLAWFIKSKARTINDIVKDSINWGNYSNTKNSPKEMVETGSNEQWCTNRIYDFTGNVEEWKQEEAERGAFRVIRSGYYDGNGKYYPAAARFKNYHPREKLKYLGFRVTLYIK